MQNSLIPFVLLGLLAGPLSASAPVHITLKASALVSSDADGFFTLGSVADLSGGNAAERSRFRDVILGRAPLPNQVRQLTPGDVLLKLRQAGFHPESDAVLEGAPQIAVTVRARVEAESSPASGGDVSAGPSSQRLSPRDSPPRASPPRDNPAVPAAPLIHRGDPVTIVVQDGDMVILARGVARDAGGAGDSIHVHREGVMTDFIVTVQDAQTVRLEL